MTPEEIVQAVVNQSKFMTRPVYRGQADADWQPESGAVRRLRNAYSEDFPVDENDLQRLVDEYQKEKLIMPMQIIDGNNSFSDLQRLSVLQHQGAATGLLDFTEYLLVALWFACKKLPDKDKDAKIFVLDIGNPQIARNGRSLADPFDAGQMTVYYEPDRSLGARIIAQQSIFVICNPRIPDQHLLSIVIPQASKEPLKNYLTQLGLSKIALFGDVPGLAAANTTSIPLQRKRSPKPEQIRDRGNRAYQTGRYEDALAAYELYAETMPHVAQPHCLKGDALAALRRFKDAEQAYTKAIKNIEKPIYLSEYIIENPEFIANIMRHALFYNRGNARAATDNHLGAVEDFGTSLQHGYGSKRDVLKNRGNSKFALHMFTEAYQDFEAAALEREGSDTALAMGNCKVMMGEFENALQWYLSGIDIGSEGASSYCRKNAQQLHWILKTLDGLEFQVRHEGSIVFVEASHLRGPPRRIPIAGNSGNTGNIPSGMVTAHGGEGYEGMDGFAVVIGPPAS